MVEAVLLLPITTVVKKMSLETSIDNLAQAITALAQALTQQPQITIPAERTAEITTALEVQAKRTRRTKEQIEADNKALAEAAQAAAKVQPTSRADEAPAAEPITETAPPTQDEVRAALMLVRNLDGSPERARAVMQKLGGSEKLSDVPVSSYAAIIAECRKLAA